MRISRRQLLIFSAILSLSLLCDKARSQQGNIKGAVVDTAEKKHLRYAIVALIDLADTTLLRSARSGEEGKFLIEKIPAGRYTLMVSFPKMADFLKEIFIHDTTTIDLAAIPMTPEAVLLQEVIISSGRPVRMRGDTLEYTADSFATRPGGNVEELLKRLPGVYVERSGKIYAQGREVQKVLVDGDEFFSDDPGLATQYLRADAIDKVQVFDQRSDQSLLTGVDDGQRTKTINLKLKENKKAGVFGKLSAGSNLRSNYRHEGMGAYFNGGRKISVYGMAYRVAGYKNQQMDLSKYIGRDYESIDDNMDGMINISNSSFGMGDQSGLPTSVRAGAHYSDKWDKARKKVFANYKVMDSKNANWHNSSGVQILPDGKAFTNENRNTAQTNGFSQELSGNFSTAVDSFSILKVSLDGARSNGGSYNLGASSSVNERGFLVNENTTGTHSTGNSETSGVNLVYQRKSRKQGRTLSVVLQYNSGKTAEDSWNTSFTRLYNPATGTYLKTDSLNQKQQSSNPWNSYAGKIVFSEKLSKYWSASAEYAWKRVNSSSIFQTEDHKQGGGQKIDSLSSDFDFAATTHISNLSFAYNRKKLNLTVGTKTFLSRFRQSDNDLNSLRRRNFINWAPAINGNLRIKETVSMTLSYNGRTNQPGIEQLQPLRRTSNNLYVVIGNPNLKPSFNHMVNMYAHKFNMKNMSSWNTSFGLQYTQQAITGQTSVDAQNRTVSQYINLNSVVGYNGSLGYSFKITRLNLRPSFNLNFQKGGNYYIQNGHRIKNTYLSQSFVALLQHEWKKVMTTTYNGNVRRNVSAANVEPRQKNKNIVHAHTITNDVFLPWKMELNSVCSLSFQPANDVFQSSFNNVIWDVGLTKKILKNEGIWIKIEVSDLLNERTGYNRHASGASIYEYDRFVIKRYFLLTASWNFSRNF